MTDYFVLLLRYPNGSEAIVDPDNTWNDIVDRAQEAIGDGTDVIKIDHIKGGQVEDCTQKAFEALRVRLADNGEKLTDRQFEFIENTFGFRVANTFGRAA